MVKRASRPLVGLLLLVVVELAAHEFVELQSFSPEALKARFRLPADCEPTVTAASVASGGGRLLILLDCAPSPIFPSHLPGP